MQMTRASLAFFALLLPLCATAAGSSSGLAKNQPIDISSDTLDVLQEEHKAIFNGNVIATQGTTNMRAQKMTVYYRQDDTKNGAAKGSDSGSQGISRIDAEGSVVFTTPTETARGDLGIYNADTDTIDLTGNNVTLTRDQNVLKGRHLNYNMATGRSVLTAGNGAQVSGSGAINSGGGRVHGIFVPKTKE